MIRISAKLSFLSPNEMEMKLKNYYKKQSILISALCNFLFFLDAQMNEPKINEKTFSEYFGKGV